MNRTGSFTVPCGSAKIAARMIGQHAPPQELLWPFNEQEKKHAPAELYFSGDRDLLRAGPCVAVVGSRKASREGMARAAKLARLLVDNGVIVVSGLAKGIDAAAHRATIEHGGRTIAVLGTPLDQCFPAEHRELQQLIMKDQLAVSQFAPGTEVGRHTFPLRNRTMALIADATVIVEATDQSGTINQGWETLRLGRPLWLAASLFQDSGLEFPAKLAFYGAESLSDATLPALLEQLPKGRREAPADLPF